MSAGAAQNELMARAFREFHESRVMNKMRGENKLRGNRKERSRIKNPASPFLRAMELLAMFLRNAHSENVAVKRYRLALELEKR